ncbi:MAG: hypothetical protein Q4C74_06990 [Rothia sp. (in: high G+C Gram-positive bacteria)]|nr:hypothetical protein [Rothia sp. (in: high G+C Gram-positive bacteria)]
MKYHLVSWAWGLTILSLLFPVYNVCINYFEGNLQGAKEQGSAAVLILAIFVSALGFFLKDRMPSLSFIGSAMAGIMLFAIGQFLPQMIVMIVHVVALIYFCITLWSALEIMDRLKNQRHSYFD